MAAEVLVTGGSKLQRQILTEACDYYVTRLLGYQLSREIVVVVKIRKNLMEQENSKADCIWDDDEDLPREFEIRLDADLTIMAMLRCLAHECVHVAQYASGKMKDTNSIQVTKWNGKKIDRRGIDYFDLPWELEAYGQETGLMDRFINAKGYAKKKWYNDPDFSTS